MKAWADDEKWPIWLVWTLAESGTVSLRAVATSREKANIYRRGFLQEPRVVRVLIEPREANHACGHDGMMMQLAGRHAVQPEPPR